MSLSVPGMKSFAVILVIGIAAMFLQGSVIRAFLPSSAIVPNIMIAVVAFLAFHEVSVLGVALSFFLGLLFDLSSGALLGPWAGAFVLVYAFLSSLTQRVFTDSPLTAFVAVLIGSLVAQGVYLAMMLQFRSAELAPVSSGVNILLEALFSAFCAPLCFAFLKRFGFAGSPRLM
jgi:rod shape-determining protein MreD